MSVQRLSSPGAFRVVYREGRRLSADAAVLYVRPNGLALSRAGVSTPRGVGGAVRRNRLRRRIREALRLEQAHVGDGFDLVLVPRATSARIPFAVLRAAVRGLLAQAGVARGEAEQS